MGRIAYEDDGGAGVPVLILGGFLDTILLVRRGPLARALVDHADEFRLVFVDHRGHGTSDAPYDGGVRHADEGGRRGGRPRELSIDQAHALGISWGGRLLRDR
jgi:pimeloyl-ACP methyl ester carboxylesterase